MEINCFEFGLLKYEYAKGKPLFKQFTFQHYESVDSVEFKQSRLKL